jgi:hypothetical protein
VHGHTGEICARSTCAEKRRRGRERGGRERERERERCYTIRFQCITLQTQVSMYVCTISPVYEMEMRGNESYFTRAPNNVFPVFGYISDSNLTSATYLHLSV